MKLSLTREQHVYGFAASSVDAVLHVPAGPPRLTSFQGPALGVRVVDERPVRLAPIVLRPAASAREMSRWAEVAEPVSAFAPKPVVADALPMRRNGSLSELLARKRGAGVRPALAAT
ncbi:MAG TPA: hypothetical protein VD929_00895 [Caulobacteraceae bacterium]|nr:hypothetical protein [Caulobacteraceae bacterium]